MLGEGEKNKLFKKKVRLVMAIRIFFVILPNQSCACFLYVRWRWLYRLNFLFFSLLILYI